jgi:indolepyruvate ferredoxin oxidoreductase
VRKAKQATSADSATAAQLQALPEPKQPSLDSPYAMLVTGVGGTGVVTVGALLGMAAHLEGKGVSVLDMTGLAQKGGAVVSHVRIADTPEAIHAVRIAAGDADALLGCDLIVSAGAETISKMQAGITRAVVNSTPTPTAEFTRDPDWKFPLDKMRDEIEGATGPGAAWFVDANGLATALMGDSIASNPFMLGYAWQKGLIPLSAESILRAIELNGVAVESNQKAFVWGRRAAHDLAAVEKLAKPAAVIPITQRMSKTLDEIVARRVAELTAYQDEKYAARYQALVERVKQREAESAGSTRLTEAVARNYYKLLAYKDEYEVGRLYAAPEFMQRVNNAFEGDFKLKFHLAPPLLGSLFAKPHPSTGEPTKAAFGSWMMPVFRLLAKLKGLRGTAFDVFGHSEERKMERALIAEYERDIEELLGGLTQDNHAAAVEIASLPDHIRGYGHIKAKSAAAAGKLREQLFAAWKKPAPPAVKVA